MHDPARSSTRRVTSTPRASDDRPNVSETRSERRAEGDVRPRGKTNPLSDVRRNARAQHEPPLRRLQAVTKVDVTEEDHVGLVRLDAECVRARPDGEHRSAAADLEDVLLRTDADVVDVERQHKPG